MMGDTSNAAAAPFSINSLLVIDMVSACLSDLKLLGGIEKTFTNYIKCRVDHHGGGGDA
jgi:hypothetical protein